MPESYMYQPGQEALTGSVRAELDALLDEYGRWWRITGPRDNGTWYALHRTDMKRPRIPAQTLQELTAKLQEAGQ